MSGFFDQFQRIYVINLASRADRRREMGEQLASVGLRLDVGPVELFTAVRPTEAGAFPSVGSRGCFLSHLGVLQKARAEGLDRILVLEDDVDFAPAFDVLSRLVAARLAVEKWSFFYGGYRLDEPLAGDGGDVCVPFEDGVGTTHFYALRGDVICALSDYLEAQLHRPAGDGAGGPMHVDGAYCWFRRSHPEHRTLLAVPMLGHQRLSRTDVHDLRWYDRSPGLRDAMTLLRRLRRA